MSDGSMRQASQDDLEVMHGPGRRERELYVREGVRGGKCQPLGVVGGLMDAEYDALYGASTLHGERVSIVSMWIRRAMVERQQKRGMRQNPSIIAVVHRYIEIGSDGFNDAKKVVDTPFPFPFAQMMVGMLLIFAFALPVQMCELINGSNNDEGGATIGSAAGGGDVADAGGIPADWLAIIVSFFGVTSVVSLNWVATELEDAARMRNLLHCPHCECRTDGAGRDRRRLG